MHLPRNLSLLLIALLMAPTALLAEENADESDSLSIFRHMDTDKDGKISQQEFVNEVVMRANNGFARLDLNGDGYVTREEGATVSGAVRDAYREGAVE